MPLQVVNIGGSFGRPRRRRVRRRSGLESIDPNALLLLGLNRFFDQQDSGEEFAFLREQLAQQGDQFTQSLADAAAERASRFELSKEANRGLIETAKIQALATRDVAEEGTNTAIGVAREGRKSAAEVARIGNEGLQLQLNNVLDVLAEKQRDPLNVANAGAINRGATLNEVAALQSLAAGKAGIGRVEQEAAGNTAESAQIGRQNAVARRRQELVDAVRNALSQAQEQPARSGFLGLGGGSDPAGRRLTEMSARLQGMALDRTRPEEAAAAADALRVLINGDPVNGVGGIRSVRQGGTFLGFPTGNTIEAGSGPEAFFTGGTGARLRANTVNEIFSDVSSFLSGLGGVQGAGVQDLLVSPQQKRLAAESPLVSKRLKEARSTEANIRSLLQPGDAGSPVVNPLPSSSTVPPSAAPSLGPLGPQPDPLVGPPQPTNDGGVANFINALQQAQQPQQGPISQAVDVENLGQQLALRRMQELGLLA